MVVILDNVFIITEVSNIMFNYFSVYHYTNMPMEYSAIFHGCKNNNFQMKNCDIFLISAQSRDCGYTIEPP